MDAHLLLVKELYARFVLTKQIFAVPVKDSLREFARMKAPHMLQFAIQ